MRQHTSRETNRGIASLVEWSWPTATLLPLARIQSAAAGYQMSVGARAYTIVGRLAHEFSNLCGICLLEIIKSILIGGRFRPAEGRNF